MIGSAEICRFPDFAAPPGEVVDSVLVSSLLRGIIGAPAVLRLGPVAPLTPGLALLPLTGAVLAAFQPPGRILPADVEPLPVVAAALAEWSAAGPVAYVEFSFVSDAQLAAVWDHGARVLGPLLSPSAEGRPVARALRRLGVDAVGHDDEFDAAGLSRHRTVADWHRTAAGS